MSHSTSTVDTLNQITAPRVAFLDERTGLVSRHWYRWLLSLDRRAGSGSSTTTIPEVQALAEAANSWRKSFMTMGA